MSQVLEKYIYIRVGNVDFVGLQLCNIAKQFKQTICFSFFCQKSLITNFAQKILEIQSSLKTILVLAEHTCLINHNF